MAAFTPFNRKAALLLAKLADMGYKDGNKKIAALGELTLNAIRYWCRSDEEYKESRAVSDGLKILLDITDPRNLLSNEVSVKDFNAFLGYTEQQEREIIDQAYSELDPIYSIFYSHERALGRSTQCSGNESRIARIYGWRQPVSSSHVHAGDGFVRSVIKDVNRVLDVLIPYWLFLFSSGAVFPLLMLGASSSFTLQEQDAATLRLFTIPVVIAAALVFTLWLRPISVMLLRHPSLIMLLLWIWASAAWSVAVDVSLRRAMALTAYTILAIWLAVRYPPAAVLRRLAFALLVLLLLCIAFAVFLPDLATMPNGEGFRGIYVHKNTLGQTLIISIIVFIVCLHHRLIPRWVASAGLLLAVALVIPTQSATAIILVCLAIFCELALASLRLGRLPAAALLSFAAAITISYASFAILYPAAALDLVGRDMSLTGRVELWRYAAEMISDKPVAGYGYAAFWSSEDLVSRFREAFGWEIVNAHNGYLDATLGTGMIGLTLLLAFLLRGLVSALAAYCSQLPVSVHFALLFLTIYLLRNVVENDLTSSWSWILAVLAALWVGLPLESDKRVPTYRTTVTVAPPSSMRHTSRGSSLNWPPF